MSFKFFRPIIAGLLSVSAHSAWAATTAQGVMVNFTGTSNLAIVGQLVYEFDSEVGSRFFNQSVQLGSTSCIGSATNCSDSNKPPTPSAPAPIETVAKDLATSVKCIFLDGGDLTASQQYQTSVDVQGLNGLGTWTFFFDYSVQPAISYVAPLTAWSFVEETGGGPVNVSIGADIAGQSVTKSGTSKKYSFRLIGDNGGSRVRKLRLTLNDTLIAKPTSTILTNCAGCLPGDAGAVDFMFVRNAGGKGKVSLLKSGNARDILNTDSVKGNDNGGLNGLALSKAVMTPVNLQLTEGEYNLKLRGEVMGVATTADELFEVDKQISIVGLGCSAN